MSLAVMAVNIYTYIVGVNESVMDFEMDFDLDEDGNMDDIDEYGSSDHWDCNRKMKMIYWRD